MWMHLYRVCTDLLETPHRKEQAAGWTLLLWGSSANHGPTMQPSLHKILNKYQKI